MGLIDLLFPIAAQFLLVLPTATFPSLHIVSFFVSQPRCIKVPVIVMGLASELILIVGGTGFLGQHLIQDLVERGVGPERIHILDIKFSGSLTPGLTYHHADITSLEEIKKVLQLVKPTLLFHMASPYPFETNRTILEQVNINGTWNLVDSAQLVGSVAAFIYTSSSSVIHDHYHALRSADETHCVLYFPEQPNYYSHTKAVAEGIVLSANRKSGSMLTVAIRPASIYGEADTTQIPNLVKSAKAGRANMQIGSENNKFDNTYVKALRTPKFLQQRRFLKLQERNLFLTIHALKVRPFW